VFLLGVKHGVDPDHLSTVDGLTRFNLAARPRVARWSGCLFSLGHGLMVMAVAAVIASSAGAWSAPSWLEPVGAWISLAFLLALGAAFALSFDTMTQAALFSLSASPLVRSGAGWIFAAFLGFVFTSGMIVAD